MAEEIPLEGRLGFALGHMLNDLSAAVWFSYALTYFAQVAQLSYSAAGALVLLGQVVDGLSTPLVGMGSDYMAPMGRLGQRKPWHLAGCVLVAVSFPLLFGGGWGLPMGPTLELVYYGAAVVLFQVGWAAVQVSHLALIPDLSASEEERTSLNALRYGTTVISNVLVYLSAWALFGASEGGSDDGAEERGLGPKQLVPFRVLASGIVAVGTVAVLAFHISQWRLVTQLEKKRGPLVSKRAFQSTQAGVAAAKAWLTTASLYYVAVLYMSARVLINLCMVYFPMFLTITLEMPTTSVAIVPLLFYVGCWGSTLVLKAVNQVCGRAGACCGSMVISAGVALAFLFLKPAHSWVVLLLAPVLGFSGSSSLVTVMSMIADLVADSPDSAAFVYGALSFCDKISTGLVVMLCQKLNPCTESCARESIFYRDLISVVPLGCAGVCILLIVLGRLFGPDAVKAELTSMAGIGEETPLLGDEKGAKSPRTSFEELSKSASGKGAV